MDATEWMSDNGEEYAVLACCLQTQLAREKARSIMSGADFYQPRCELIWNAMERLDRQGVEVDAVSLMTVLRGGLGDRAGALHQLHTRAIELVHQVLMGMPVSAASVEAHAATVREYAVRRRLYDEVKRAEQLVINPATDVMGLSASIAKRFTTVRDTGFTDDIESLTVEELLLEVDEEPDWLIPGFLERSDRFMLTGEEGLGKSHLLRQIAILAHAGIDPFRGTPIKPIRGMIIDAENSKRQIRRRLGTTYGYAASRGKGAPGEAAVLSIPRSDITTDRVLNKIHRELDHRKPDILVIGPLYKLSPRALQTDDEAGPGLAALDTIRERGVALLIEAHAGHIKDGSKRDLRPRGSASLMGWPEFGYGMRATGPKSAVLVPWRGDREARDFPLGLTKREGLWVEERPMLVQDYWRNEDWSDLATEEDEAG